MKKNLSKIKFSLYHIVDGERVAGPNPSMIGVGDVVTAWSTSKKVRISAIGESRLLYIDIGGTKERVASFNLPWRKIKTLVKGEDQ